MKVLFLGGPWHNERHEVTPGRLSSGLYSLPTRFNVPVPVAVEVDPAGAAAEPGGEREAGSPRTPHPRPHVTYLRRFARSSGERLPVYVSPDYHGPARA